MNETEQQTLIDLANAYIEKRLDDDQQQKLEQLISESADARRIFADLMHDHAALHWDQVSDTDDNDIIEFAGETIAGNWGRTSTTIIWAAAAAVAISAVGFFAFRSPAPAKEVGPAFATMEKSSAARWESGDLPTAKGSRLTAGKLRLAEGIATLKFDSGAEVILEAPAEVQLVDRMNCVLTNGTAVADIPESAIGFQIKTPSANVVDYGTRFAVNVDDSTGATKTQVFEGLVEVEHPDTGKIVKLETGEHNFVAGNQISDAAAGPDEGDWAIADRRAQRGADWKMLPAARDSYAYSVKISDHTSDVLLLLKNSSDSRGPHRKAYVGFDLKAIPAGKIADAELILNFTPTGWGLASSVSDATFSVYGITDSTLDNWNYRSMTWENAPANKLDSGNKLQSKKVQKLGKFTIEQGIQRGQFGISGESLADFLKKDSDGIVTLAIVRDTVESGGGGLVHGIASRRHPVLPAPTLAIQIAE